MQLQAVIVLCLLGVSSGFFWNRPKNWDDLKVTWGINPFNSKYFDSLPRTTSDAKAAGWDEITMGLVQCDTSPNKTYRGRIFVKNDFDAMLVFDKNGYIAGIQTQVSGSAPLNYPAEGLVPPFVQNGYDYFLTAYFTDPATICTTGRTAEDFKRDGTGKDLYIQTGPHPDTDYMKVPTTETELAGTKWVEGKCFDTMGKHYWYDISDDMSCDRMFPVFLLYNKGKLNAFGWVMTVPLEGARYEHPGTFTYKLFMKSVPKCLATRGEISTMHIFLTSSPRTNFC